MGENMSELNFDFLMNCDQLEIPELGIGFQEMIPDISQESSPEIELAADFLSGAESQPNFTPMPFAEELLLGSADSSNLFNVTQPEEQQNYQLGLESIGVPSTTSQMDSLHLNPIQTGYGAQQFYDTKFVNCRKRKASSQQCETTIEFDTTFLGANTNNERKPKRKRVQNARQRKAANVRERKRMVNLNDAFDNLKTKVPTFAYENRLSRIETLKLAMSYISFMTQILNGKKTNEISLRETGHNSVSLADLGQLKSGLLPSYVSDGTESSESSSSFS